MIVNLTYFVQIINFLIGYWFIKKFLFGPMLAKIENENRVHLQLEDKITILNELILINKKKLSENWHNFYQTKQPINFCKLKPAMLNQFFEPREIKSCHLTRDNMIDILLGELDDK